MAQVIKCLTTDELQTLIDHLKSPAAQPHEVLFELILTAGLRSEEAVRVKYSAFKLDTGLFSLDRPAKGSDKLTWDLNVGGLAERLRRVFLQRDLLLFEDDPIIWLFTDNRQSTETAKRWLRRKWSALSKKLYGESFDLGIHCLRHTYGVEARKHCSIEQLQQLMRHKSLGSTYHYMMLPTQGDILIIQRELAARLYDKNYGKKVA